MIPYLNDELLAGWHAGEMGDLLVVEEQVESTKDPCGTNEYENSSRGSRDRICGSAARPVAEMRP